MIIKIILLSYQKLSNSSTSTYKSCDVETKEQIDNCILSQINKTNLTIQNIKSTSSLKANPISNVETINYELSSNDQKKENFDNNRNSVLFLKSVVAQKMNITPDCLILYLFHSDIQQFIELKDEMALTKILKKDSQVLVLYYSFNDKRIKLRIQINQRNIQRININLASNCSILMLKHIINKKLSNNFPISLQKIYFVRIGNLSKKLIISNHTANDKELSNDTRIEDIIHNTCQKDDYVINLMLVLKGQTKFQAGINFSFNCLNSVTKIGYEDTAPNYRECNDGLNLFCDCKNESCDLFNEMFVIPLGYGEFNIIGKELNNIKCPKCPEKVNQIILKNIGLINSQWNYRALLYNTITKPLTGGGITLDEKLYLFKETNFKNIFQKLFINVKEFFPHKNLGEEEIQSSITSNYENEDCISNNNNQTNMDYMHNLKTFVDWKNNKVKKYDEEVSIEDSFEIEEMENKFCNNGCFSKNQDINEQNSVNKCFVF